METPPIELIGSPNSLSIDFSTAINTNNLITADIILVCTLEENSKTSVYLAYNLSDITTTNKSWVELKHTFKLYDIHSLQSTLKLYIWNKGKASFSIDDVRVKITTFNSQYE